MSIQIGVFMGKCLSIAVAALGIFFLVGSFELAAQEQSKEPIYLGKSLTEWLAMAKSSDVKVRARAVGSLRFIPQPSDDKSWKRIIPVLIEALSDPETAVRQEAASVLANTSGLVRDAIPQLVRATQDKDTRVAQSATQALAHVEGPLAADVVKTLAKIVEDSTRPTTVRTTTCYALGGMGLDAVPAVKTLAAATRDAEVRSAAISALAALGVDAEDAIPEVIDAFKKYPGTPRILAARFLGACGPRAKAALPALKEAFEEKHAPTQDTIAAAYWTISRDADTLVPLLTEMARRPDQHIPASSILAEIGPKAKSALPAVLAGERDPKDKTKYRFTAAGIRAAGALDPQAPETAELVAAALKSNIASARVEAAFALWKSDRKHADEALAVLSRVLTVNNFFLTNERAAAARYIGQMGADAKPAIPDLEKMLRENDLEVRAAAALALMQLDPEQRKKAIPVLVEALELAIKGRPLSGPDGIIRSLGAAGPAAAAAIPLLEKAAFGRDASTRQAARAALLQIKAK